MARTAIATDSNSGITQSQAKELGVFVLPMPFFMRGKIQFEDIDLTQEQFYEILAEDAAVSTSQPSPGDLMDFWNKILEEYDDIVYVSAFTESKRMSGKNEHRGFSSVSGAGLRYPGGCAGRNLSYGPGRDFRGSRFR